MKLWGVSMVRNEADIIEAFVRHNLGVLDGLSVVDHGSADATREILLALAREGLPLVLVDAPAPGYLQEQMTTSIARAAFAQSGAQFVLPLDADEFLKVGSRDGFRRALAAIPPRMHGLMHWLTYVPDFAAPRQGIRALLGGARRVATERHPLHKAVIGRHLLEDGRAMLSNGNHYVAREHYGRSEDAEKHARIRVEHGALAHVPIRSAEQLVAKVAMKKLGRIAANFDWNPDAASQVAYQSVRDGGLLDAATLAEQAVNWSIRRDAWLPAAEVELVDDPFLASFELRYTPPGAAAPLPLVASAVERMVRRLAAARGATGAA